MTVLAKPYRIENLVAAIESALSRETTASRATVPN
jgi:hypothetical protein